MTELLSRGGNSRNRRKTHMTTQTDIHFEINVLARPELAYNAISKVREWWISDTEGEAVALGDSFTVNMGEKAFVTFKVTESQPGHRYVWHVDNCLLPWFANKTEWTGTDVIFDIIPTEDGSLIKMVHRGLTPEVECYNVCNEGWEGYFESSLYKLITEGVGSPN